MSMVFLPNSPSGPEDFPLEFLNDRSDVSQRAALQHCPLQQGMANDNPDVDAVYRMTSVLPITFEMPDNVALAANAWCPFNSQNTTWFKEAFPLMYLPSFCSFRMTDIWRSFIAQRIAWTCNWSLMFHGPTVYQERNEHNLLRDFEEEIPGYLNNANICATLSELDLRTGVEHIPENLLRCYKAMVHHKWIDNEKELDLLENWIEALPVSYDN